MGDEAQDYDIIGLERLTHPTPYYDTTGHGYDRSFTLSTYSFQRGTALGDYPTRRSVRMDRSPRAVYPAITREKGDGCIWPLQFGAGIESFLYLKWTDWELAISHGRMEMEKNSTSCHNLLLSPHHIRTAYLLFEAWHTCIAQRVDVARHFSVSTT